MKIKFGKAEGRDSVMDVGKLFLASFVMVFSYSCSNSNDPSVPVAPFTITEYVPAVGRVGDTLAIKGEGMERTRKVLFNNVDAKIVSATKGVVKVIIPTVENNVDALVSSVPVKVYSSIQFREFNYNLKYRNAVFTLQDLKYEVDTVAHYQVGPGTYFTAIDFKHANLPLKVYYITSSVEAPHLRFRPVLAEDELGCAESVIEMGKRKTTEGKGNYFAGVNADFFNMGGNNYILDGMNLDGKMVALPTENGVGSMVVMPNGELFIDELSYPVIKINVGDVVANIDNVNQNRKENQLVMYNRYYDTRTFTNNFGTEAVIKPVSGEWKLNEDVEFEVIDVFVGKGNTTIPDGCAVLSGHGTKQEVLNKLNVGDKGTFNVTFKGHSYNIGSPLHTMGVKPLILKDGKTTSYVWDERHPRTALGLSADRKTLYMCVVDGRWENFSVGTTVTQLALLMKRAGADTAFNLDGGGSSTMFTYNTGYNGTGLMNRPNGGTYTRKVANAFFAVADVPEDNQIAQIVSANHIVHVKKGKSTTLKFYGINQHGIVVNNDVQGVKLVAEPILGSVDGYTFKASNVDNAQLEGFITATYQGLSTKIKVYVE